MMFGNLANLANVFKQAHAMQGRMAEMTERLRGERVMGKAGGGMVEVTMNGTGETLAVRIDPTIVARGDVELLEDLLPAAINDAQRLVNELRQRALGDAASGLNLPGLDGMLEKMLGTPPTQP